MFTANTMNCLCEALGMALPGNGTILAPRDSLNPAASNSGSRPAARSSSWSPGTSRPRDILTAESLDNAFALDMAMGGSTNTVLHTLAIAIEAGIRFDLARINEVSDRTPHICKVSPVLALPHRRCRPRRRHHGHPHESSRQARPAST